MPENPIGVDTSKIDTEAAGAQAELVDQSREERKKFNDAEALANEQQRASDAQAAAEQQDPRNAKKSLFIKNRGIAKSAKMIYIFPNMGRTVE